MITAILADDENHARERLRGLLDHFEHFDIIAEASDGNEALQLIITHKPDVVFLDINMPGISVFQSIPSLQNPPLIIFQTAYSQYAADAYDIDALDYLMKPVRIERLEKTVEKILEKLTILKANQHKTQDTPVKSPDHVTITIGGNTKLIPTKNILRISFEEGICYLYTLDEKFVSDKYLSYYEEKLRGNEFFRTSRTDIINMSTITMIHREYEGSFTLEMINGMRISLSRRKAQQLRKIIDF